MSSFVLPIVLAVIAFGSIFAALLAIQIIMCVYVHKDAKARGLNAAFWLILTLVVPGYLGFIVYLLKRDDKPVVVCAGCKKDVKEEDEVCPSCGAALKNKCPSCGNNIENDWNVCAFCNTPITPEVKTPKTKEKTAQKGVVAILVLSLLIPVLTGVISFSYSLIFSQAFFGEADNIFEALPDDLFDGALLDYYSDVAAEDLESGAITINEKTYDSLDKCLAALDKNPATVYILADESTDETDLSCRYLVIKYSDNEYPEFSKASPFSSKVGIYYSGEGDESGSCVFRLSYVTNEGKCKFTSENDYEIVYGTVEDLHFTDLGFGTDDMIIAVNNLTDIEPKALHIEFMKDGKAVYDIDVDLETDDAGTYFSSVDKAKADENGIDVLAVSIPYTADGKDYECDIVTSYSEDFYYYDLTLAYDSEGNIQILLR